MSIYPCPKKIFVLMVYCARLTKMAFVGGAAIRWSTLLRRTEASFVVSWTC